MPSGDGRACAFDLLDPLSETSRQTVADFGRVRVVDEVVELVGVPFVVVQVAADVAVRRGTEMPRDRVPVGGLGCVGVGRCANGPTYLGLADLDEDVVRDARCRPQVTPIETGILAASAATHTSR